MKKYFPALQYLNVPNVITSVGMVFGIIACYFLAQGDLRAALICLFFSGFMDLADGFFAGRLNQKTVFGQYVDSLVDFFICCIIPIWIVFGFVGTNIFLIAGLVFYCLGGLWRLAYFNVISDKEYFNGLPVPGAMFFVVVSIWTVVFYGLPMWVCVAVLFLTGGLMISCIRMAKYGFWQKSLWVLVVAFLVLVIVS